MQMPRQKILADLYSNSIFSASTRRDRIQVLQATDVTTPFYTLPSGFQDNLPTRTVLYRHSPPPMPNFRYCTYYWQLRRQMDGSTNPRHRQIIPLLTCSVRSSQMVLPEHAHTCCKSAVIQSQQKHQQQQEQRQRQPQQNNRDYGEVSSVHPVKKPSHSPLAPSPPLAPLPA